MQMTQHFLNDQKSIKGVTNEKFLNYSQSFLVQNLIY